MHYTLSGGINVNAMTKSLDELKKELEEEKRKSFLEKRGSLNHLEEPFIEEEN
ncbi:hypothetical protein ACFL0W_01905 [Nanoarchaeota archaeon]